MDDALTPDVESVFRMVMSGKRGQINQAINNYRNPSVIFPRYYLFEKTDSDGRNLLHYACIYNTDEVATWMLLITGDTSSRSPIPRISDNFGATAVMYAANTGKVTFVQEWIKEEACINTVDEQGSNTLHYCCGGATIPNVPEVTENSNIGKETLRQMSDLLIDNGITYNCKDMFGRTPIQYILNVDVDCKCFDLQALQTRNTAEVWKCIYACAVFGTKPLHAYGGLMHLTVAHCFIQGISLFNKAKADQIEEIITNFKLNINELDDNGMTALHHLCFYECDTEAYGMREVLVAKLLELGADPNIKDIRGYTPLMCAIEKGYAIKYDPLDPRCENDKGIGQLLKINAEPELEWDLEMKPADLQMAFTKKIESMTHKIKAQEATFKEEIATIMAKHNDTKASITKEITCLKSIKEEQEMKIMSLKASKDSLGSKYIILQENLRQQEEDSDKLNSLIGALKATNAELHQKLKQSCQEIAKLKSNDEDLYKVNSKLTQKLEDQTKVIVDLKMRS